MAFVRQTQGKSDGKRRYPLIPYRAGKSANFQTGESELNSVSFGRSPSKNVVHFTGDDPENICENAEVL